MPLSFFIEQTLTLLINQLQYDLAKGKVFKKINNHDFVDRLGGLHELECIER